MSMITIGSKVGWGSDHIYAIDIFKEGVVVAEHGHYLVILNEDFAAKHPHVDPFIVRRREHVREIVPMAANAA